jgi:molecular chaperone DnaK
MTTRDVLAVDFGTTNSYYCKCPGDQLTPKGVDFGDGRDGLATAILYREDRAPLVGHVAIEEYGEATPQERKAYTLRTHFKPDIATGTEARTIARDFLAAVLDEARHRQIDLAPARREVIFGVPSEAADDFRTALAQVAKDAGYGDIRMLDEPKGALLYHIFHKDMPARDALKGLLVVDFGGGTCDFAFMSRGSVRHSWGDMQLGGRLFDDLFFQWFLDANPGALKTIAEDGSEYFVHSYLCREMKEFFSRTMARDMKEPVTKAVRHYGRVAGMTWEEFTRRARSYRPSPTFRRFLASIGSTPGKLIEPDVAIDLLAWFRDCLRQGLSGGGIEKSDIRFVILAGGSSQWPFVVDILRGELKIDTSQIMRSDRPYAVISEGLAILPALQEKFRVTQEELREELPEFCRERVEPAVRQRAAAVAMDVASAVTQQLFDEQLRPLLEGFRTQGGTIASLRKQVSSATLAFEPRLRKLVEEGVSVLTDGLPIATEQLVKEWFDAHGIAVPEGRLAVRHIDASGAGKLDVEVPDFYGAIISTTAVLTTGITTTLVAMVCGGHGTALIASGPVGWAIGAIIGLVVVGLTVRYGAERARQMAEEWHVPGKIRNYVLTDKKIGQAREKLFNDLAAAVEGAMEPMRTALAEQVTVLVEKEIEALSEINEL